MRRTLVGLAVLLAALMALPTAALAKHRTYTAYAGEKGKAPASAPTGTALNRFFPRKITVRKGDKVKYLNYGFHTVTVVPKGQAAPAVLGPDPAGGKYTGINDPKGKPFFFDGLTQFLYDPVAWTPQGSHTIGDGKLHNSGAFSGAPGKYKLKFAKTGKYKVICLLHAGMVETVKVVGRHHRRDSKAKVRSRIAKQMSNSYADAKAAAATVVPANTVYEGEEKDNATLLAFAPASPTVAKGTTITFVNHSPSELHNLVFIPTPGATTFDASFSKLDQPPVFPGATGQVDPALIYGSSPDFAHQPVAYDGQTFGGNGFLESPGVDADPATPLAQQTQITFTRAGKYAYYCRIHGPDMSGTITVLPGS